MDSFIFKNNMKDLEMMFTPLSDFQRDIYYKHLRHLDEEIFKKGIKYLLDTHPWKRTPLISEILEAINKAALEQSEASIDELDRDFICDKCGGIGIKLYPVLHLGKEYMTAFPCACPKGQRIGKAWRKKFEKKGGTR